MERFASVRYDRKRVPAWPPVESEPDRPSWRSRRCSIESTACVVWLLRPLRNSRHNLYFRSPFDHRSQGLIPAIRIVRLYPVKTAALVDENRGRLCAMASRRVESAPIVQVSAWLFKNVLQEANSGCNRPARDSHVIAGDDVRNGVSSSRRFFRVGLPVMSPGRCASGGRRSHMVGSCADRHCV
jgi:hypothetical protein